MKAVVQNWKDVPAEQPVPGVTRRHVSGEQAMVAPFEVRAGGAVPWQPHPNGQISVLLSGRARFGSGSTEAPAVMEAGKGDTVVIPGGLPHQVTGLVDGWAYDVFAPPRQDWLVTSRTARKAEKPDAR